MSVLVHVGAAAISAAFFIGMPVAVGISHADPCAPGAGQCNLPNEPAPPSGGHIKCADPKPGAKVCGEPGDAEIHSRPNPANIPKPPLTVEPTKSGAAL